jgi:hypothetical protein
MAQLSAHRRKVCPRCGSLLARDERSGIYGALTGLLCLRGFRCTTKCGWRSLRFSRSRLRQKRKRLKSALIVAAFMLAAVATVRYMLSRSGSGPDGAGTEGIGEVAP